MNKRFFILLFLAIAAHGQMQERIAIINTMDDFDSINVSALTYLTDRLRETAVNVLPAERFGVMTTESIVAFLGSMENTVKVCKESSCLAELGRKVSADYVAQGRTGRFGNDLTIKVELYNVTSGNLIGSFSGDSKDIYGLRDIINEKAPDLFKKMLATPRVANQLDKPHTPEVVPVVVPEVASVVTPTVVPADDAKESDSGEEKVKRKLMSFGVMTGLNLSHITFHGYDYGDAVGVQLGAVVDFAPLSWFRIQPGIMYIQKGMKDKGGSITAHYFELPLQLSLKLSAFRFNTGPYIGLYLGRYDYVFDGIDYGWSAGIGYDIGKFAVGVFYDLGLTKNANHFQNRTLGFNFGVNL
ncbi:MAG: PorT family protein [Fibromonadaceae bacterium]|nr:PorT family protein [Fibromonadaceae bacterium]